jgi:hypothetical protein
MAGESWAEVAAQLGYANQSNAYRAVRRYFGTVPQPNRDDLRLLWRERHEVLWRIAYADALSRRPGAVRAATALARSAAQLDGLDEATRIAVELAPEEERRIATIIEAGMLALGMLPACEADIFGGTDA